MSKSNDRMVVKRPDGTWGNQRLGAERPATVHETQKEAAEAAKEMLETSGGGELIIQGRNGQIRSKDTIAAPDPNPPKDREH